MGHVVYFLIFILKLRSVIQTRGTVLNPTDMTIIIIAPPLFRQNLRECPLSTDGRVRTKVLLRMVVPLLILRQKQVSFNFVKIWYI